MPDSGRPSPTLPWTSSSGRRWHGETTEPRAAPGLFGTRPAPVDTAQDPAGPECEEQLTEDLVGLVREHGRLGYRKMAALLRSTSGWVVNDKRVERIWRQEGLKVPPLQPKRSRTWPGDGACNRLRAERPNHVWSYDFVEDRTHDGRKYCMLSVVDEFTRECLSIRINQKLKSLDVIDCLSDLFILRGVPQDHFSGGRPVHLLACLQTRQDIGAKRRRYRQFMRKDDA